MSLTKKLAQYFGSVLIASCLILMMLVTSALTLEYFLIKDKKDQVEPLVKPGQGKSLATTPYYGKAYEDDPYRAFTIQHLHPYYLFSLPWQDIDRLRANNPVVTVGEDGFRVANKYSDTENIVLLGGSTAFGHFSSSDDKTIASILGRKLKKNVVNRNAPSWNSHQELVALVKYSEPYRASISFSSANDVAIFCSDGRFSKIKDQMESYGKLAAYFNDIRAKPRLVDDYEENFKSRIYNGIRDKLIESFPKTYSEFVSLKNKRVVAEKTSHDYCGGDESIEILKKIIIKNQTAMRQISMARGAKHFFVIQPLLQLHKDQGQKSEDILAESKFRKKLIKELMGSQFCKKNCLDLSATFDSSDILPKFLLFDRDNENSWNTAIFVDNVHLTDKGVTIVSEKIYDSFHWGL